MYRTDGAGNAKFNMNYALSIYSSWHNSIHPSHNEMFSTCFSVIETVTVYVARLDANSRDNLEDQGVGFEMANVYCIMSSWTVYLLLPWKGELIADIL